jgi:hypothetical protein
MMNGLWVVSCVLSLFGAVPFPGKHDGLTEAKTYPADTLVQSFAVNNEAVVCVEVTKEQDLDWRRVFWSFPATPGEDCAVSVDARTEEFTDGHGAALSLAFHDAEGKRLKFVDAYLPPEDADWLPLPLAGRVPEGAVEGRVSFVLHGRGKAFFRRARFRRWVPEVEDAAAVTLRVRPEKMSHPLLGFGAEDDGWYFNQDNAKRGVNEDNLKGRQKRLEFLKPQYVRMFFWYRDWNLSLDSETYTWDSVNMESHYRSLEQYQRLGARVNVCGVEWAVEKVFDDPEKLAKSVGDLLEHLIVKKGFTCIREWTLTNEPNLSYIKQPGNSFAEFVQIHRLVAQEFERRGLDIDIIGSDDGDGPAWYQQCIQNKEYAALADAFAFHYYIPEVARYFMEDTFRDRLQALKTQGLDKPVILAEFGIRDHRFKPPATNPFMREYPYALWTTAALIDGLNGGVSAFSIWCLQEVYYPGGKQPMELGLWDFDTFGETARPVYHALANFTRNTTPGDPIRRVTSSASSTLKAARVGDTLFWVNFAETEARVRVEGVNLASVHGYTEPLLENDWECAEVIPVLDHSAFTAPPRSFGRATIKTQP